MPALPNIVYIHSHDTGRYVQPYGYAVSTPHYQALAEQGILFRRAYSTAPTCSPSRACLPTGQWPHSSGMIGLAHAAFGSTIKASIWCILSAALATTRPFWVSSMSPKTLPLSAMMRSIRTVAPMTWPARPKRFCMLPQHSRSSWMSGSRTRTGRSPHPAVPLFTTASRPPTWQIRRNCARMTGRGAVTRRRVPVHQRLSLE